ncbi:gdsl-like lipase acylhydrolase [Colletotrichum truncatum]|uniref:Gdsl-like lipase acylhydrolase n=1 Tax=Colletotrichum truncatum TaxID=5467 RepID=A0ACC3ZD46_COLTU|nr:gdsl-like lipase acylhydrolase [Colletotrichum truncatum]KAF6797997.1 gdsl-like lipase acylhydrolase [Colletotrichum truncatum]
MRVFIVTVVSALGAFASSQVPRQAPPAPAVPLRIMALGASVTFGTGSTTGNSYRKDLQDLLVAKGMSVTFVGTRANGNFPDNAVEATGGFKINQIAASADKAVPMLKPNLVLVDAGTNNCNKGGEVPDAGANVTAMINKIYEQSPGSTVILTSILANKVPEQDACRVKINEQYNTLAAQFQQSGAKFALVDMRSPDAPTLNDLNDTRHPNDGGYVKMANVWAKGIQEVMSKGFITAPL